jgi:hypothetical protein
MKIKDSETAEWGNDPERTRRAARLLLEAEKADQVKLEWKAKQIKNLRKEDERTKEKQALANEWNALFKALELPLHAYVQTVRWDMDGAHPEVYVIPRGREESWAMLVNCLKKLL